MRSFQVRIAITDIRTMGQQEPKWAPSSAVCTSCDLHAASVNLAVGSGSAPSVHARCVHFAAGGVNTALSGSHLGSICHVGLEAPGQGCASPPLPVHKAAQEMSMPPLINSHAVWFGLNRNQGLKHNCVFLPVLNGLR